MLNDLLTIVDMENLLTGEEKTIGGFDLIYRGDFIDVLPKESQIKCLLGTDIPKEGRCG